MRKNSLFVLFALPLLMAGCVDINDPNVKVLKPGEVGDYQRSPLDKCPPHTYPHRLILGQVTLGSALLQMGTPILANDQPTFDTLWNDVSPQLDQNKVPSFSLKPLVNWDQETAYFLIGSMDNTCDTVRPYGEEMTTDCVNVSILLYRERLDQDCQPVNGYPVFIYIYPKTSWGVGIQNIYPTATVTPIPTATATPTPRPTAVPSSEDE